MEKYGIRQGQEIALLLYRDQEFLGAVLIAATAADQVSIHLHHYDDAELVVFIEALMAAKGAVQFEMDKPRLRKLVEERIKELNEDFEGKGGSNPPTLPTTDSPIIPF